MPKKKYNKRKKNYPKSVHIILKVFYQLFCNRPREVSPEFQVILTTINQLVDRMDKIDRRNSQPESTKPYTDTTDNSDIDIETIRPNVDHASEN